MRSDGAISVDIPFCLDTWTLLANPDPCESCGTPISVFKVTDENDEDTGEQTWVEIVDQPEFGSEHTPARCRARRNGA